MRMQTRAAGEVDRRCKAANNGLFVNERTHQFFLAWRLTLTALAALPVGKQLLTAQKGGGVLPCSGAPRSQPV
jgi:hypothetical protein